DSRGATHLRHATQNLTDSALGTSASIVGTRLWVGARARCALRRWRRRTLHPIDPQEDDHMPANDLMSALLPKADMRGSTPRFQPKATFGFGRRSTPH